MKIEKPNHSGIVYPKVTTLDVAKAYWKGTKKYFWYGFTVLAGLSLGTAAFTIIVPVFYKKFFDTLEVSADKVLTAETLVAIIISILLLNVLGWLLNRIAKFALVYFESYTMRDLRQGAYDYVLGHSHGFFASNFTGSLVQRINRFTRGFETISDRILLDIVPLVIKVGGAIVVLGVIDVKISLGILIWVLFFMGVSFIFTKMKLRYDIEGAALDSKVSATLSDSISNHSTAQLFSGIEGESKFFSGVNGAWAKLTWKRWSMGEGIDAIQALLNLLGEFIVFYVAIKYWEAGAITLGTFALIQTYVLYITGSLWGFARIIRGLYEATADAKEMVEILHLPHEVQNKKDAPAIQVQKGSIEFKNVDFAFGKNKPVVQNLSLSIKAGERVALIGTSGAGKSTLVRLLLRLFDVKGGSITIDGQNIADVTQESLRENISLVPQDPALFHRTLMENIRYGKQSATNEDVIRASELAHADVFIKEFPLTYETYVGERGIKLSGGERQRVAIARAILKNAPILILDEATSSLDSHSEILIQDALDTLMKGKTTIVIAHRLSTIKKMDRIIVLGKTGIMEEGSHDELLKKPDGMYARLWNLQAGGFGDKNIEELLEQGQSKV